MFYHDHLFSHKNLYLRILRKKYMNIYIYIYILHDESNVNKYGRRSEREVAWIYSINAFCIQSRQPRQSKTFIEPGGIAAHAIESVLCI